MLNGETQREAVITLSDKVMAYKEIKERDWEEANPIIEERRQQRTAVSRQGITASGQPEKEEKTT